MATETLIIKLKSFNDSSFKSDKQVLDKSGLFNFKLIKEDE
jgi:hypothetical protein